MKKQTQAKGITLIALIITIIVMLILSGVIIAMLTGENGIIKNTQTAEYVHGKEKGMEQVQLVLGDDSIERSVTGEKLTLDRLVNVFKEKSWVEEVEKVEEKNKITIINDEGYVYDVIIKEEDEIEIEYVGKNTGPIIIDIKVTSKDTNSVEIEVKAMDTEGAKYTYWYKKEGETEYKKAGESESNTYKYTGLKENEIYNFKVEIETSEGKAEKEINEITGEMPEGTITFDEVEWSNGEASVTVNTTAEGYILQYQIGTITGEWEEIENGGRIEGLNHNSTAYARLWDGTNGTEPASVDIKDEEGPKVEVSVGNITTNSAVLTVTASDEKTGLATEKTYKYYLGEELKAETTESTYAYTGLTYGVTHTLKVVVTDKVGNTTTESTTVEVTEVPSGKTTGIITFTDPSWSNGQASITITTSTSYTLTYQKNSTTGTWTPITSGATISGLTDGDIIYARLYDGTNYGDHASVNIEDGTAPTVSVTVSETNCSTAILKVTASDGQMGLATTGTYKYYLGSTLKQTTTTNGYVYINLSASTAYTLKVIVADKAGNETTKTANITTKSIVPSGFVGSSVSGENAVSTGYVIYQGTAAVTSSNHSSALTSRNQYVWIPVSDVNSMSMCSSNKSGSVCNLAVQIDGSLKCTVHSSTATTIVGRLYPGTVSSTTSSGKTIYKFVLDFTQKNQTYSVNSGEGEPVLITGNTSGTGTSYDASSSNYHGYSSSTAFLNALKAEYKAMATSVAKNGGFYVARYEMSSGGASKKAATVLGNNNWYSLYKIANSANTTLNSHMIWLSQKEQIINFIGSTATQASTSRQITTAAVSGNNANDKMKNIYDLEGNCVEWTACGSQGTIRNNMGGFYQGAYNGNYWPASVLGGNSPTSTYAYLSSRITLYL